MLWELPQGDSVVKNELLFLGDVSPSVTGRRYFIAAVGYL